MKLQSRKQSVAKCLVSCFMLCFLFDTAMSVWAQAVSDYMPPDYRFCDMPNVSVVPGDPCVHERLRVADQNRIIHSIDLDQSPQRWAHHLLRIGIGYRDDWSPSQFYALFPHGYKGKEEIATVALDTVVVKFPRIYQADGPQLQSSNYAGYTLGQEGEYLVVGYRDQERWYFDTADGGTHWRLAKLGWAKHPDQFTTLEYTNGQITALRFPNGEEVRITNDGNGLPIRIDSPWGEITLIEREAGLITKISKCRELLNDRRPKPAATYRYEYSADRKIRKFINSFGLSFDINSAEYKAMDHGIECVVFETMIRNVVDGSFSLHRQVCRDEGSWRFETWWGTAKDTKESALLESTATYRKMGKVWRQISEAKGSETRETNYELDKLGSPKAIVDAEGRTRLIDYNRQGKTIRQVTPNGKVTQTTHNEYGQPTQEIDAEGHCQSWEYDEATRLIRYVDGQGRLTTYEYDNRGFCKQVVVNNRTWQYRFDEWGRLVQVQDPLGNITHWVFDPYGQLTEEAHFHIESVAANRDGVTGTDDKATLSQADGALPPLSQATSWTQYNYDELGHLTEIERSNGDKEQFLYEPRPNARLAAHIKPSGIRVTYAYDALRRLSEIRDPTKGVFQYWYYPSGALRISRTEEKGKAPMTCRYNHVGELLSKTIVGEGETQYVYDKAGVLVRKVGPDGKPIEVDP